MFSCTPVEKRRRNRSSTKLHHIVPCQLNRKIEHSPICPVCTAVHLLRWRRRNRSSTKLHHIVPCQLSRMVEHSQICPVCSDCTPVEKKRRNRSSTKLHHIVPCQLNRKIEHSPICPVCTAVHLLRWEEVTALLPTTPYSHCQLSGKVEHSLSSLFSFAPVEKRRRNRSSTKLHHLVPCLLSHKVEHSPFCPLCSAVHLLRKEETGLLPSYTI